MMTVHDVLQKIEKVDEEIIRLLAERTELCREAQEEDSEMLGAEHQSDVVAQWDEASDEHGWNPGVTMRICRGIVELCRQAE